MRLEVHLSARVMFPILLWCSAYIFNSRVVYSSLKGFPDSSLVKHPPASARDEGSIPGQEDPLEKEMTTHTSILAWGIPRTEEPSGLESMASQRVGHNLATKQHVMQPFCGSEETLLFIKHFHVPDTMINSTCLGKLRWLTRTPDARILIFILPIAQFQEAKS